jgi:hypothetical protein
VFGVDYPGHYFLRCSNFEILKVPKNKILKFKTITCGMDLKECMSFTN